MHSISFVLLSGRPFFLLLPPQRRELGSAQHKLLHSFFIVICHPSSMLLQSRLSVLKLLSPN